MPAAQQKLKANELIERLDAFVQQQTSQKQSVLHFELERIKREAEDLLEVTPIPAHDVLGRVAAIQWNKKKTDYHYKAALQKASADDQITVYNNYSAALERQHYLLEAARIAEQGYKFSHTNLTLLTGAIKLYRKAGHLKKALQLITLHTAKEELTEIAAFAKKTLDALEQYEVEESTLFNSIALATAILRKHRINIFNVHHSSEIITDPEDESDSVLIEFRLKRPVKEVVALSQELDKAIILADLDRKSNMAFVIDFGVTA